MRSSPATSSRSGRGSSTATGSCGTIPTRSIPIASRRSEKSAASLPVFPVRGGPADVRRRALRHGRSADDPRHLASAMAIRTGTGAEGAAVGHGDTATRRRLAADIIAPLIRHLLDHHLLWLFVLLRMTINNDSSLPYDQLAYYGIVRRRAVCGVSSPALRPTPLTRTAVAATATAGAAATADAASQTIIVTGQRGEYGAKKTSARRPRRTPTSAISRRR